MKEKYIKRIADKSIEYSIRNSPGICIEGPKWCGKTTSARINSKSELSVISKNEIESVRKLLKIDYKMVLTGETPMLIDEWQNIPELWDYVRYECDYRNEPKQFILTGSAIVKPGETLHSGAGRITTVRMHTMSLYESGESNGSISMTDLFNKKFENSVSELTVSKLTDAMIRGGWPFAVSKKTDNDIDVSKSFVDNICKSNIVNFDGMRENPIAVRRMVSSISRNICTTAKFTKIYSEMIGNGNLDISEITAKKILGRLQEGYVVENLHAWNEHIRSREQLITGDKWYFCDPSIPLAALNTRKDKLYKDMEFFGFAFESLCLRDLRVYVSAMNGEIYYYKQKNGFEIDFIIELPDGRWAAIEAKLGVDDEEKAAKDLIRLKDAAIEKDHGGPEFLMILTGGKFAYRREDGIYVVPIGCLRD